jgi:hypothetical protein
MKSKPKTDTEQPINLDLRSRNISGALTPEMKRFDIFLIDTGWNTPISKLVRSHLPLIYEYQRQDSLYLLSSEQSIEILKRSPELIGHDPTVVVYDLYAPDEGKERKFRGFRLNLGRFKHAEQAMSRLQDFVRFINLHRTASCLECEVKRELHREGLTGMVKILRETSAELL